MGTFPKPGDDRINRPSEINEGGGNHDLAGIDAAGDLLDQLPGGPASGLGIARIDGQDFRVEKLHQRRAADAGELQRIATLLLEVLAGAEGEGIRRADQGAGFSRQHAGDGVISLLHAQPRQGGGGRQTMLLQKAR